PRAGPGPSAHSRGGRGPGSAAPPGASLDARVTGARTADRPGHRTLPHDEHDGDLRVSGPGARVRALRPGAGAPRGPTTTVGPAYRPPRRGDDPMSRTPSRTRTRAPHRERSRPLRPARCAGRTGPRALIRAALVALLGAVLALTGLAGPAAAHGGDVVISLGTDGEGGISANLTWKLDGHPVEESADVSVTAESADGE